MDQQEAESRLSLLRARPLATRPCDSDKAHWNVEFVRTQSSPSTNSTRDTYTAEFRLAILQARAAAADDIYRDFELVEQQLEATEADSSHDALKDFEQVHDRNSGSWGTELDDKNIKYKGHDRVNFSDHLATLSTRSHDVFQDIDHQVESRFSLLRARSATARHPRDSSEGLEDVKFVQSQLSPSSSSSRDAELEEIGGALLQAQAPHGNHSDDRYRYFDLMESQRGATQADASHGGSKVIEQVNDRISERWRTEINDTNIIDKGHEHMDFSDHMETFSTGSHDASKDMDHQVESRLSLLRARLVIATSPGVSCKPPAVESVQEQGANTLSRDRDHKEFLLELLQACAAEAAEANHSDETHMDVDLESQLDLLQSSLGATQPDALYEPLYGVDQVESRLPSSGKA